MIKRRFPVREIAFLFTIMKVLLLGGSGLLGHHVLRLLLQTGHEVSALLRRQSAIHLPSEFMARHEAHYSEHIGSLLDYAALRSAAEGCDAIINCAGVTDMSLLRYEDYLPVNCDLCFMLLRLMSENGISRLVHVGTANTIGYGTADSPAREDAPMQSPFTASLYARSKWAGEQALLREARQRANWHVVVVCPGFMIGDYDVKPSSGQLLLTGYRKPLMAVPRGGKSFVAASDVAVATVNALTLGTSGEQYLLTGENMNLADFYRLQALVCCYRQRVVVLPTWLVLVAGAVGSVLRWFRLRTQLSLCNVRQLLVREYYDNSLARRTLAMPSTPVSDAIAQFFEWYGK